MNYAIVFLRVVFSVTNKMTAGAKSFGSFFTGVVNKAGAKIKETVKDNVSIKATNCLRLVALISVDLQSILGEFNKEQEAFIKDQSGKGGDAGICPWVGHGLNEDKIKEEILSLSGVSGPRKFGSSKIHDTIFSFRRIVGISFALHQLELILSSTTMLHIQQRSPSWRRTRNWRKCASISYLKCKLCSRFHHILED